MSRPDRGEYRSVHTVLLDGPDFQRLSPGARWVFVVLKLTTGSAGIMVVPGLVHVLAERTGYPPAEVEGYLGELVAAPGDWLQREGNVVWVVRQLEFEPSLTVNNPKHRRWVASHVAGLPRLAIVSRFSNRYRQWLDAGAVPTALGIPSDTHSNGIGITTTTTTTTTRDNHQRQQPAADGNPVALPYLTRCVIALNAGLAQNPALTGFREVCTSEQVGRVTWDADGIPVEVAEQVVRDVASRYKPTPRNRQPASLRYFDAAVREAHERATSPKAGPAPSANPFDAVLAKLDQEDARAAG